MGSSVSRAVKKAKKTGLLDLSVSGFKSIPTEVFRLSDLVVLYLTHNQLESLPQEFQLLSSLKVLYLHNNQLTSFPDVLCRVASLTWLNLNSNRIQSVPAEIGKLTALKELYLRGNCLSALPVEIGQCVCLNVLYLYENDIQALPSSIGRLSALTEISLNTNKLRALPAEFCNLISLTKCDVSRNALTELPTELGRLAKLRELFVDANQLGALPDSLYRLPTLELLSAAHNLLSELPSAIGQLSSVTALNLCGNALVAVPAELAHLSMLASLDLSHNRIGALPAELGQLRSLQRLNLEGNPVRPPLALMLSQGTEAVLGFLRDIKTEQSELQVLSRQLQALRDQLEQERRWRTDMEQRLSHAPTISVTPEGTPVAALPSRNVSTAMGSTTGAVSAADVSFALDVRAGQPWLTVSAPPSAAAPVQPVHTSPHLSPRHVGAGMSTGSAGSAPTALQQRMSPRGVASPPSVAGVAPVTGAVGATGIADAIAADTTPVMSPAAPPPPPPAVIADARDSDRRMAAGFSATAVAAPVGQVVGGVGSSAPFVSAPVTESAIAGASAPFVTSGGGGDATSGDGSVSDTAAVDASVLHVSFTELEISGQIGEGYFADVFHARWNGLDVAVKRLKTGDERRRAALFQSEVALWSKLRHPNVVLLLGAVNERANLSIVLEYLPGGTLYRHLRERGAPPLGDTLRMARQLALALNYLHRLQPSPIIHRDLSSVNVLLDGAGNVKLGDFGESRLVDTKALMTGAKGNFLWMAPEVFRGESYDTKADVYSYGLVLWEMLTGEELYAGYQPASAAAAMAYEALRPVIPASVRPPLRDFLPLLWHAEPAQRPSFAEIVQFLDTVRGERRGRIRAYTALDL